MNILMINDWGKKPPKHVPKTHIPRKITIHHQGAPEEYPNILQQDLFNGSKTLKSIQRYHMETMGYIDIAYHAIIAPNGDRYQGREFNQIGAHVKNNNTNNIGIMLIGNFNYEFPTKLQMRSLTELICYLKIQYPTLQIPDCIYGHKDFIVTDCPGKNLYPIIFDLRYNKLSLWDDYGLQD
jgi:hypothetical protein